ncbi:oligosaccharide MFS transporter [Gilliamella sp. B3791]|uniref:oligosaccharide MFS transporter n=1 Tax=unclassified Gilliamella TaxID=2685620 RepID=UPI002269C7A5|nr:MULTISPECIES: oligosaccharide MFS transporter [unclassified Gilliamella]MCX8642737.1 oligosaccharide MFS transporter [Gilliamella sp. B3835]MCX8708033.1 oligosaccharide MFS transporter [Gilliamella sp. B3783]MCX8709077.1 oligosaccharide MFS transporter [Gilliamella sp. B3780]MCX8712629.1 oligosaccharide MFS transporter [Gilliamella sp. B3468]MCX8717228.1 oligosaccharide MFS transporter [Gilliamella sp. B3784]
MNIIANRNYWFSSGYLITFYAAWSLWWSFYAIWLKSKIGLSGEQLGTVYAANSAAAMFFMIFYGIIQDKLQIGKAVITFQSIVMILIGPFLIYVYEPLLKSDFIIGVCIGAPVLSAGFISGCALIDSFIERISRLFGFEFGPARFWGSFGYAAATFVAGILFGIDPHINFWMASAVAVIFFIINLTFTPKRYPVDANKDRVIEKTSTIPTLSEIFSLFGMKKFWLFVFFIIGTNSFYTIYDQQLFPNFYTSFFEKNEDGYRVYGYLNSFQVFLEAACMILAPYFINKVGAKKSLLIAALVMICRIALSASLHNVYLISLIKLFHAIETPLFILAVFKYVVANFDARLSSTLYLVGFNISSNIGVIALSWVVGKLFDNTGYSTTFYVLASIVLFILIVAIFTLTNDRKNRLQSQ